MSTSSVEQVHATDIGITEDEIVATLEDGRTITVPLAWFPRLLHASVAERNNYELIGDGVGIHWPDVDEDLSIAGFLAGLRAPRV
jgi:hypothetical protein